VQICNFLVLAPLYIFISPEKRKHFQFIDKVLVYGNFGGSNYPYDALKIFPTLSQFTNDYKENMKTRVPVDLLDASFKMHDMTCTFAQSKKEAFENSKKLTKNMMLLVPVSNSYIQKLLHFYGNTAMFFEALGNTPYGYKKYGYTEEERTEFLINFEKFCTAIQVYSSDKDIKESDVLQLLIKENLI